MDTQHTTKLTDDSFFIQEAIEVATRSAASGGGPFGAVLVKTVGSDVFLYTENNHVTENNDPTAHAEVSVIRLACKELGTFDLSGWTLYSSCEPCPMCLGAALWARVDRIVYAADRHDAAEAGFDDAAFYKLLEEGKVATQLHITNATQPFQAWADNTQRIEY